MQNSAHKKALCRLIGREEVIFPMVVFGKNTDLRVQAPKEYSKELMTLKRLPSAVHSFEKGALEQEEIERSVRCFRAVHPGRHPSEILPQGVGGKKESEKLKPMEKRWKNRGGIVMSIARNKERDLTTGPLVPKIILFALPLMATGILQLMFNAADLIIVGQFAPNGQEDIGAIGGTGPLINLVINLFIGLSVGTSVLTARYIGAGDREKTGQTVHTSMAVALIGGIVCFILGFFFARTFLSWMGTIDKFLDSVHPVYADLFYRHSGVSHLQFRLGHPSGGGRYLPSVALSDHCRGFQCDTEYHHGGMLPKERGRGGLGFRRFQIISAGLVVWYLAFRTEGSYKLEFRKIRIHKARLWELIRIGVPAGVQGALYSLSNIIIQSGVNSFNSKAVVSGSVASSSIDSFIYSAMTTFNHAALSFIGQNIGAGKPEKIGKITGTCLWMVSAVGILLGLVTCFFGEPLLRLYVGSEAAAGEGSAIYYGMIRLRIITLTYFTCGIMEVFSGSLRGMGASLGPTVICLTGVCGIRILWIYTIFRMEEFHKLNILFYSYPVSWVITGDGTVHSVSPFEKENSAAICREIGVQCLIVRILRLPMSAIFPVPSVPAPEGRRGLFPWRTTVFLPTAYPGTQIVFTFM